MESEGIFIRSGKGGMARVVLEVDLESQTPCVVVELNDSVWNTELKEGGFSDWLEGAIYGVEFALKLAKVSTASVKIVTIAGLLTDTTATNIAAAAANGVWSAVDFQVPQQVTDKIRQAVLVEWNDMKRGLQKFE